MKRLEKWLASLKRPNDPRLPDLVAKYGLEGRVNWTATNRRGRGLEVTFVRVLQSESEKGLPLPPEFITEAQKQLQRFYRQTWGKVSFQPPQEMTQAEIDAEIKGWTSYCALRNLVAE